MVTQCFNRRRVPFWDVSQSRSFILEIVCLKAVIRSFPRQLHDFKGRSGVKCLFTWCNQAILTSGGRQIGGCRPSGGKKSLILAVCGDAELDKNLPTSDNLVSFPDDSDGS